jgi:hypothetical protein
MIDEAKSMTANTQLSSANQSANALLLVSLLGLTYGIWSLLANVYVEFHAWTAVFCALLVLAAALSIGLFLRFPAKLEIAFAIAALVLGTVIGNQAFFWLTGRSVVGIFESKVVGKVEVSRRKAAAPPRMASGKDEDFVSSQPAATRDASVVHTALVAAGIKDLTAMRPAHPLLPLVGLNKIPPFLPLSTISNTLVVFCNEGDQREYPILRTDRYGYNNDDTVFAYPKRILVVGDSYAQGSCVHQEESVAGVLRRNGYPANSAAIGGFDPILELAALKEYGERQQPKAVLWLYFDGNDIVDLAEKGLRSSFLLQYLDDKFSQSLMDRQPEVDAFWKGETWAAPLREYESSPALKAQWEKKLDENLPLVRKYLGEDITSLRDDENLIRIFGRVMAIAKRRTEAWGGKLYFVFIANMDDYLGGIPTYRLPVLNEVRRLGIPVIDTDQAVRAAGDPMQFFPLREDWGHFNAKGYRLMSRQIMARLDEDFPPPPPPAATAARSMAPTGVVRLENKESRSVSAVLSEDPENARADQGDAFLGFAFVPRNRNSILHVRVKASVYAAQESTAVFAVFVDGITKPIKLVSKGVGSTWAQVDFSFDHPARTSDPVAIGFRVGASQPGTILLNDPSRPSDFPNPTVEITDSQR